MTPCHHRASTGRQVWRAVHWLALRAYPVWFRREFGDELQRSSERRLAAAWSQSRRLALWLAALEVADALAFGLAERWRLVATWWAWPRHIEPFRHVRSRRMTWESIAADLRLALRQCRRAPLFALLTVASLALGIGANSAMFGVVHAVLLRPLPYGEPDSLVTVWSDNSKRGEPLNPVSPANFEAFRAAPSLADVEAMYSFLVPVQYRMGSEPENAQASMVTPGMFALLGRDAVAGRTFREGDPDLSAVLSHQFWRRRFGQDPNVVGRTVNVTGESAPVTILGVMPEDFVFPYKSMLGPSGFTRALEADVWLPLTRQREPRLVDATGQPNRNLHYLAVVGRLKPGVSLERARMDLSAIATRRAAEFADTNAGWGVTVRPLHEQTVGSLRPALLMLLGGVGVVLLITCINVANVLLARAAGRGRDLAIRSALGASRRRLVQQMLIESLVLAAAGGAGGLALMVFATRAILAVAPTTLPRLAEVSPGVPVVLFAMAVSILTGLAVGTLPAVAAARSPAQDALREGSRATASRARRRIRAALIVAEVAMAMTLTIGAGLLLRSFVSVLGVDPGFQSDRLLTLQVSMPSRYADAASRVTFYDELEARLRAVPGVVHVGGTTRLPLGSTNVTTTIEVEGGGLPRAEWPEVEMRRAVFDYFATMGIPLVRGRTFTAADGIGAPLVVVVNTAFAERLFPGADPVGRRVRMGGTGTGPWLTIVGVAGSIRHGSLEEMPKPELYTTYRQGPPVSPFLAIRTRGDAGALTAAVRQVIRDAGADPPTELRTMEDIRSRSVGERRFVLLLAGLFGALALVLAALGVYGVITLVTAERTMEVGIRLALGATPSQVLGLVIGHAVRLAVGGILLGGATALLLAPVLQSQLFGVQATDPLTYGGVAALLAAIAVCAALVPARRAMRVDPAHTLRN